MKCIAIASLLSCIAAVCIASPTATAQWHYRAPDRGCVEVSHSVGGSAFRTYACDGASGPCAFAPHVDECPTSVLFHKPNLERLVNIRSRDHLVRFYNQIGGACFFSILPNCCGKDSAAVVEKECRCEDLPNGKRVCDPTGCEGDNAMNQEGEACKCVDLPNGDRVCDPYRCESDVTNQQKDGIQALLEYFIKNN